MDTGLNRSLMSCPMNGKICKDGVREDFQTGGEVGQKLSCRWWTHVVGKDPQTEKLMDHYDCGMAWIPVVMLEVSQMTRHNTASTDKVANVMNETKDGLLQMTRGLQNVALEFNALNENVKKLPEPEPKNPTIDVNGNGDG